MFLQTFVCKPGKFKFFKREIALWRGACTFFGVSLMPLAEYAYKYKYICSRRALCVRHARGAGGAVASEQIVAITARYMYPFNGLFNKQVINYIPGRPATQWGTFSRNLFFESRAFTANCLRRSSSSRGFLACAHIKYKRRHPNSPRTRFSLRNLNKIFSYTAEVWKTCHSPNNKFTPKMNKGLL